MDLRHLLTLRMVVEKGSFSQAAEELEISQPAVSFQIRSLEQKLGQRLLDRSGRRVSLTEPGEVVYRYARRIIGLERESLIAQRKRGQLSEHVMREMEIDLDLEEALFARDPEVGAGGHLDALRPGSVEDDDVSPTRDVPKRKWTRG